MTNYERIDELHRAEEKAFMEQDANSLAMIGAELDRVVPAGYVDFTPPLGQDNQVANYVLKEIAEVGELLNCGEYQPMDAYKNLIDVYWGWQKELTSNEKHLIQELIFGYAKDSGIDFEDAIDIWVEQSEMEDSE